MFRGEVLIGPKGSPRSGWWSRRFGSEAEAERWVAAQQQVDTLCHAGRVRPAAAVSLAALGPSTAVLPLFDDHPEWGIPR